MSGTSANETDAVNNITIAIRMTTNFFVNYTSFNTHY